MTLAGTGAWGSDLCQQRNACRECLRFFAMASTAHHCHLLPTVCDWSQQPPSTTHNASHLQSLGRMPLHRHPIETADMSIAATCNRGHYTTILH